MQIRGKLTPSELNEVHQLVRPKMYWPKLLFKNLYGILLLTAILWATVAAIFKNTHANWSAFAIVWSVIVAIFAWSFYSAKNSARKEFSQLSAALPDNVLLEEGGVRTDGPNGAMSFRPWQNFKAWRTGKRVMLLDLQSEAFIILPLESDAQAQLIQNFVASHLNSVETELTFMR